MPASADFATPARALLTAPLAQVPYLPAAEIEDFVACWTKTVALKRGDFLVQPGQTEQYLYFSFTTACCAFFTPAAMRKSVWASGTAIR